MNNIIFEIKMNSDWIMIICLYVATILCVIISIHFDKRTNLSFHDILFIEYAQIIEDSDDDDDDSVTVSSDSATEYLSDEETENDDHLTNEIIKYNETSSVSLIPEGYILLNENHKYQDEMLYKSLRRESILRDIELLNSGL